MHLKYSLNETDGLCVEAMAFGGRILIRGMPLCGRVLIRLKYSLNETDGLCVGAMASVWEEPYKTEI